MIMKILIVCSINSGYVSPFIRAQAESIAKLGVTIKLFQIKGKGVRGYLSNIFGLKKEIKVFKPDLIHAHYGLSGLLATLQRDIPVIITFHGSDINVKNNIKYSYLAARLSKTNIFVHPTLPTKINFTKLPINLIPCGVNINVFYPKNVTNCLQYFNLESHKKNILFSSRFNNPVKNYSLAIRALRQACDDINLIELKGYSPQEVNSLMNSVDLLLVTSHSETGPLVVKEAMACNCPVVATDVGDVAWLFGDEPGHFLTSFEPQDVTAKIQAALNFSEQVGRTNGRERIIELGLDSETIARRIINVYESVLKKNAK